MKAFIHSVELKLFAYRKFQLNKFNVSIYGIIGNY